MAYRKPHPNPYKALGALVPFIVGTWGVREKCHLTEAARGRICCPMGALPDSGSSASA